MMLKLRFLCAPQSSCGKTLDQEEKIYTLMIEESKSGEGCKMENELRSERK